MALLAEPSVVTDLLPQDNIPAGQLAAAQMLVAGWLREDAGLDTPPVDLAEGDALFAAAFELVVLVVTNPSLLSQKTVGPTSRSWPVAARRDAIRAAVKAAATKTASAPQGSFPAAPVWPDPALPTAGYSWDPTRQAWVPA